MARATNPNREKAKQIYIEQAGNITNRKIAEILGEDEKKIAVWKQRDKWIGAGGNVVQQKKKNKKNVVQQKKRCGAPLGNKNAKGNRGGNGGPPKNKNAEKHGFFSRIFPDDPEIREIIAHVGEVSPLEMLWENITIQYTAIVRAQKLMYVRDQDDITKHLKKEKYTMQTEEKEWEFQFPWDKHANFLQAQARAIQALLQTIERYQKMLPKSLEYEEQRLKVEKLKAEISKINNTGSEDAEDWVKALEEVAQKRRAQVSAND